MSHKTVYMGIPAEKLCGEFSPKKIASVVSEIMGRYVEETASEENIKCDWYEIGGRWAGAIGAIKGTENILPSKNGLFAYKVFEKYDAVVNGGQRGPYFVDEIVYIPVDAGLKKCIAWDSIAKLDEYKSYRLFQMILRRDPRLGTELPKNFEIKGGDLYINGNGKTTLVLKNGESFYERADRMGKQFGRVMMPPDAYIDTNGVWHDDSEEWAVFEAKIMSDKFDELPENPEEAAHDAYLKKYEEFLDTKLKDDDCFVILDCHCFS